MGVYSSSFKFQQATIMYEVARSNGRVTFTTQLISYNTSNIMTCMPSFMWHNFINDCYPIQKFDDTKLFGNEFHASITKRRKQDFLHYTALLLLYITTT